jgi:hypothetical protein
MQVGLTSQNGAISKVQIAQVAFLAAEQAIVCYLQGITFIQAAGSNPFKKRNLHL